MKSRPWLKFNNYFSIIEKRSLLTSYWPPKAKELAFHLRHKMGWNLIKSQGVSLAFSFANLIIPRHCVKNGLKIWFKNEGKPCIFVARGLRFDKFTTGNSCIFFLKLAKIWGLVHLFVSGEHVRNVITFIDKFTCFFFALHVCQKSDENHKGYALYFFPKWATIWWR